MLPSYQYLISGKGRFNGFTFQLLNVFSSGSYTTSCFLLHKGMVLTHMVTIHDS